MPGCPPAAASHDGFIRWCLEEVNLLSGAAAVHFIQTQGTVVENLPGELLRKVSIWAPAQPPYELPDEVEELAVRALVDRRELWAEATGEPLGHTWSVESQSSYAGVGLPDKSRAQLLRTLQAHIPTGWQAVAHHMTICMGDLEAAKAKERADNPAGGALARVVLGQPVLLLTEAVGRNDEAVAVRVSGFVSKNETPHITLAISPTGKPAASNAIEEWDPLPPQRLLGVVRQYKYYHLWKVPLGA
eukprot:TRINITY_DN3946_c0_g1_i1.p1 TRINITY_DN3946_c0_g1~~TRINITY_DN3946_c0_g1_i1.p1  ORF type:complete len:263 (+),score=86.80 TRINITY_DN3946_c0_g1_i1:56-790(+)